MQKNSKRIFLCLTIIITLLLIPLIKFWSTYHYFNQYLLIPKAEYTIIDTKHFDSSLSFSITNNEEKQKLLDLIKNNLHLSKGKMHTNEPIDSLHNTYSIIIWSTDDSDYSCVLYVSSKEPQYCYFTGQKFDYYITGCELITNYLDEYVASNEIDN